MLQETYITDDACKITTCFLIGRNKMIIAVSNKYKFAKVIT